MLVSMPIGNPFRRHPRPAPHLTIQRTRHPGAPNPLAEIIFQIICLITLPMRPGTPYPEIETLLTFIAGHDFDLPASLVTPLRATLRDILLTLPPPPHAANTRPRAPARAKTRPIPRAARPIHTHIGTAPARRPIPHATSPPAHPRRKIGANRRPLSHALIVPVS